MEDGKTKTQNRVQAWPTHRGLYDGSGYGGEMESTTSRPSTSTYKTVDTSSTLEGSASLGPTIGKKVPTSDTTPADQTASWNGLTDHETLEEIMRAYAVYEESEAVCTTESDLSEDVELANKTMHPSLSA